jgi:hypothetical protein
LILMWHPRHNLAHGWESPLQLLPSEPTPFWRKSPARRSPNEFGAD